MIIRGFNFLRYQMNRYETVFYVTYSVSTFFYKKHSPISL
jgi:hypothetical protein